MASQQSRNPSHNAGEAMGHSQMKKNEMMDQASHATQQSRNPHDQSDNNQNPSITAQATTFIQHTGEQVKNMAQGAAEAVKNTLGMNENTTNNSNNPSDNPNNNSNNPSNNSTSTANNSSNPNNNIRIV